MNKFHFALLVTLFLGCSTSQITGGPLPAIDPKVGDVPIAFRSQVEAHGSKWMVSTQGKYATSAAADILKKGGTVIDAAIIASLVIGVERPQSTGLGGGGFLIYHEAQSGKNYVFDFRERAPGHAKPNMYLSKNGDVIDDASVTGSLAVAVPGMVRGLVFLHSHFTHAEWNTLVKPAIKLAESGFPVYPSLAKALDEEKSNLAKYTESKQTFLHEDGSPYRVGELLVQKNLAHTLKTLSASPEDFYRGKIAHQIVDTVKKYGGIMTLNDLATYPVKERKAVVEKWRGYQVVSMPPPSSGGIHVLQILKMLENDPLETIGFLSPESLNLEAQAMQQSFADRARFLADPDFKKVPTQGLLEAKYLKDLRSKFHEDRARSAGDVGAGAPPSDDELNTSHFSIMDAAGNTVVSTQTINGWFGSKVVAEGTGIVLNNEMDDFTAKVGASNIFGATSTTDANAVEARKTPLSSMSPTILLDDKGMPVLALGAPGGTRIITSVAQTILNYVMFHQDLYRSIAAVRIHQQWKPDVLSIENQSVSVKTLASLKAMGWDIERVPAQSNVMAVAREGKDLVGVADPRDIGTSSGE